MSPQIEASIKNAQVSVICPTYNHDLYIAQALDGFVAQQTSFPFVVLVGDDASADNTPNIVLDYARRYPEIIIPILRTENIGAGRNWKDLIDRCSSPYLAFCDGDDYWTDSHKLQKQYNFMEANPRLRACFHDVEVSVETDDGTWFQSNDFSHTKDGRLRWPTGNIRFIKKASYTAENYISFGFVQTSSMFIRWDYNIGFPEWSIGTGFGDFPMWIVQVNEGRFGYIDEVLSVYRKSGKGVFDFATRTEFWHATKPGSIAIDEGLLNFFSTRPGSQRPRAALQGRQRDDLAKLTASILQLQTPENAYNELSTYRKLLDVYFQCTFPHSFEEKSWKSYTKQLAKKAPLPPYRASLSSRIRRIIDIARIAFRTAR